MNRTNCVVCKKHLIQKLDNEWAQKKPHDSLLYYPTGLRKLYLNFKIRNLIHSLWNDGQPWLTANSVVKKKHETAIRRCADWMRESQYLVLLLYSFRSSVKGESDS